MVHAPAKLNLHLEIMGRRADGFHELETLMVAIDRCDLIQLTPIDQPTDEVDCAWLPHPRGWEFNLGPDADQAAYQLPPTPQNLAYRALVAGKQALGIDRPFRLRIDKRIPAGAGMGGASADAAGVLVALARYRGIQAWSPELIDVAARLGSDIPFMLAAAAGVARAGWATGRGEQLRFLPFERSLPLVVVYPARVLSTALVYKTVQLPQSPQSLSATVSERCSAPLTQWRHNLLNRLQEPAMSLEPKIHTALAALERAGLQMVRMTGSGAACFGVARSTRHAHQVSRTLHAQQCGMVFASQVFPIHRHHGLAA